MSSPSRIPRVAAAAPAPVPFVFIGERLWLDFVNTDDLVRGSRADALADFDAYVDWLHAATVLDAERAAGIRRRALQQPTGATAALLDARRVRDSLRALAEQGRHSAPTRAGTL